MNRSAKDRKIQSLTDQLAALKAGPSKKKKARNRRKGGAPTPGTSGTVGVSGPAQSNMRGISSGDVRLKRRELLTRLTTDANGNVVSAIAMAPSSFPWLGTLSKSFERIKWYKCAFTYAPAVGTTTNGTIAIGIDYSFSVAGSDYKQVVSLTPSVSLPIWQGMKNGLSVPVKMLQSRLWYILNGASADTAFGKVVLNATSDKKSGVIGDIWVEYDVELSGTVFQ